MESLLDSIEKSANEGACSVVTLIEIYSKYNKTNESMAKEITGLLLESKLKFIPVDMSISFSAARKKKPEIPIADAIIAATAESEKAVLVAADRHFDGLAPEILKFRK